MDRQVREVQEERRAHVHLLLVLLSFSLVDPVLTSKVSLSLTVTVSVLGSGSQTINQDGKVGKDTSPKEEEDLHPVTYRNLGNRREKGV